MNLECDGSFDVGLLSALQDIKHPLVHVRLRDLDHSRLSGLQDTSALGDIVSITPYLNSEVQKLVLSFIRKLNIGFLGDVSPRFIFVGDCRLAHVESGLRAH